MPVPTLEQVRAYVRVPATTLSDDDLERMRATCLADQAARCTWSADPHATARAVLTVDDMTAGLVVTGGAPGAYVRVHWGDGATAVLDLDEDGAGATGHAYADPGEYGVLVTDASGLPVGSADVTVPGAGVAPASYPVALAQALLRRVQREIAGRNLPLGMVGLESEYGPQSIPAFDALVEHHEHAYRRVVLA